MTSLEESLVQQQAISGIYLPEIECEIRSGDADWEVVATVQDSQGRKQNLSVSKGMVASSEGKNYLTVGIVQVDHLQRRALIELPHEADSGVNRLWAPFTAFRRESRA